MRRSSLFMVLGAVVLMLGILAGCSTEGKARIGEESKAVAENAGPVIQTAGETLEAAGGGIFGTLLKILGGALVAYGGVSHVAGKKAEKVSDEKIARFDAAPDTVAFASDGSQTPIAPPAVPPSAPPTPPPAK